MDSGRSRDDCCAVGDQVRCRAVRNDRTADVVQWSEQCQGAEEAQMLYVEPKQSGELNEKPARERTAMKAARPLNEGQANSPDSPRAVHSPQNT